jgi:hypothetical protein
MHKFDVFEIDRSLYAVVQAEHLLGINTVVVVPIRPADLFPAISRLTVDIEIGGAAWRTLCHMPLTLDARLLTGRTPVHRLSSDEGQKVMDGLNTVMWGL